jgi:hypothetical protein
MKKLSAAALLLVLVASASSATAAWTHKLSIFATPVKTSAAGVANITLEAATDFTIDTEQPPRVSVIAPEGIVIEKIRRMPVDQARPEGALTEIEIAFTAAKKGKHALTATVDFAVCTKRYCEPASETLTFDINVQ